MFSWVLSSEEGGGGGGGRTKQGDTSGKCVSEGCMKTAVKLPHLFIGLVCLLSGRLHSTVALIAPLNPQLPSAPHLHFNLA